MIFRYCITLLLLATSFVAVGAFVPSIQQQTAFHRHHQQCEPLFSSKAQEKADVPTRPSLSEGTLIEFSEKKRVHIGTILNVHHKAKGGGSCYDIEDTNGKRFNGVADKQISFSIPNVPNNKASQMLLELEEAQAVPDFILQEKLDISPELLEMVWEEAATDDHEHLIKSKDVVELVHSRDPTHVETYMAWRLLQSELAHVFFKEMKDHGRIVQFKAKSRKAVQAAKQNFCKSRQDDEFCFAP